MIGRVLGILICTIWRLQVVTAGEFEKKLIKDLLDDYNPMERPVKNESRPVQVELGLSIQQLIDVDEKNQIMTTNVWLTFRWRDENLVWDPEKYGGVKEVRIQPDKLWKPDILLYNSVDQAFNTFYSANVVVKSNGAMEWIPPGIVQSTCSINIAWFPFDDQLCTLKFGSWTYGGRFLELKFGGADETEFSPNGEFLLLECDGKLNRVLYECCPDDPYFDITFTVHIRRRTLYYGLNLVIPCLLIALMALLDFVLPPGAQEKLTLGITVFMSLCVFLMMVAEAMPPTSEAVPLIGVYFSSIMIIVSASQVMTVLVLNFYYRDPYLHELPFAMRKIFLEWMPWILMMEPYENRPGQARRLAYEAKLQALRAEEGRLSGGSGCSADSGLPHIPMPDYSPDGSVGSNQCQHSDGKISPPTESTLASSPMVLNSIAHNANFYLNAAPLWTSELSSQLSTLTAVLRHIHIELQCVTAYIAKEDAIDDNENDWHFCAVVLDRLCLVCFTTVFLVTTCAILFAAPQIVV